MRSMSSSFFLIGILLCVSSSFSGAAAAATESGPSDAVHDTFGMPMEAGKRYHIYTAYDNQGIRASTLGPESCPVNVVVDNSCDGAEPVIFHPADPQEPVVRLSVPTTIRFSDINPCTNTSIWQVHAKKMDCNGRQKQLVKIGGEEGKPGCDTYRTWFKIRKATRYGKHSPNIYFIEYNPTDICEFPVQPGAIGPGSIYAPDQDLRSLELIDGSPPFFVFQQA
ncbi:kunitz trypsin inhibitor 5-like [Andrographis paniculata]|uniref:kunitz trypsin inhibitor 5-like n=1 Tax=Andrographis paniculata TaxID=175694 RepID=UPI0021E91277|nr:kunitz trypsin inhibitor 5-like [Andrographis paniculata]